MTFFTKQSVIGFHALIASSSVPSALTSCSTATHTMSISGIPLASKLIICAHSSTNDILEAESILAQVAKVHLG